jgi:hypothetical protein
MLAHYTQALQVLDQVPMLTIHKGDWLSTSLITP